MEFEATYKQGASVASKDFPFENSNTAVTLHHFVPQFSDIFDPYLKCDFLSNEGSCAEIEIVDRKLMRFYGLAGLSLRPLQGHSGCRTSYR